MRISIILILVLINFITTVVAQQNSMVQLNNTEVKLLSSSINHINYKLYVSLPTSYNDSTNKKYSVLFLLDADYSFAIAKNIVDHLAERNHLQEIIIIGVAYDGSNQYRINRTRDYTPTNSHENVWFTDIQDKYSGGGPQFLSFLELDLIPMINQTYRTTMSRVLVGHSYGGLFSTWVMLTRPDLFTGYIVVSPSLWYDDRLMFRLKENLHSYKGEQLGIYFAVGSREINKTWNMPKDLNEFVKYLETMKIKSLRIKKEICADETHNSIFPRALSNGLRFIYGGF